MRMNLASGFLFGIALSLYFGPDPHGMSLLAYAMSDPPDWRALAGNVIAFAFGAALVLDVFFFERSD